ncbi:hypothetical protein [Sutcliffiella halmapala]|uniref:hypothetical protein n=1 Tax=Sutcliffiella halmapala TaxID=79882 RepID=UPI000994AF51|nr:hypothetical protein [Sutcliffiella halmapala]
MEDTLKLILTEIQELRGGQQKLEKRMGNLEVSMDNRIETMATQQERMDNQMEALVKGQERMDNQMDTLVMGQCRLETKFDNLETKMRSSFKHLDEKLDVHKEIVEIVSQKLQ